MAQLNDVWQVKGRFFALATDGKLYVWDYREGGWLLYAGPRRVPSTRTVPLTVHSWYNDDAP